ncbi:MAG TPA: hypothetical protein VGQ00_03525 [Candidatus Norongarragalinales archaeon]|jgi:hypothetical protein|nr:hypothetical protein [Candidatus Norongarragalinales archaeon]
MSVEKPRLVGVFALSPEETMREFRRVSGLLSSLPKGTRIGFAVSRSEFERLVSNKDATVGLDLVKALALNAHAKGLEVVPLDSEKRSVAVERATGALRGLQEVQSMHLPAPLSELYEAAVKKAYGHVHAWSRFNGMLMAKKMINQDLPVTVMSDVHVKILEPALKNHFVIDKSPEGRKWMLGVPEHLVAFTNHFDEHMVKSLRRKLERKSARAESIRSRNT